MDTSLSGSVNVDTIHSGIVTVVTVHNGNVTVDTIDSGSVTVDTSHSVRRCLCCLSVQPSPAVSLVPSVHYVRRSLSY